MSRKRKPLTLRYAKRLLREAIHLLYLDGDFHYEEIKAFRERAKKALEAR